MLLQLHMPEEHTTDTSYSQFIDVVIPAYNARDVIRKSASSSLLQELPENWRKNVIIVDDGSSDNTAQYCQEIFDEQVKVIAHKQNLGRSSCRNTGWRAGFGRYVIFLDADCEWLATGSLHAHLKTLEAGADVSTGSIVSCDPGFWGTYQNNLQSAREKVFSAGNLAAFTSANFAIRRSVLEASGGFDEDYRYYGFEDRDFLLRLISLGAKISFCPEAAIIHNPDLSLRNVCGKIMESGRYSSTRFQNVHPAYYAGTSYGKIDCRLHGVPFTTLAIISEPMIPFLALLGDKMIDKSCIPFRFKQIYVKMISGLAYMAGTYHALKNI